MKRTCNICTLPKWESELYWDVRFCISRDGVIDLWKLPSELEGYTHAQIDNIMRYIIDVEEDTRIKREVKDKWVLIETEGRGE